MKERPKIEGEKVTFKAIVRGSVPEVTIITTNPKPSSTSD
jgi:hypothetical protein